MNPHLSELRARIIRCIIVYLVVFGICFYFSSDLYTLLAKLIDTPLIATKITATFMVPLQLCLFCALLATMPYILYHIWSFIRPGLHLHERRNIAPWLVFSCLLFYAGISFALLVIAPMAINFFTNYAASSITVMIDIGNYLDFIATLAIASGLAFQVPIVTIFMLRTGIISQQQIKTIRPYVIIIAFILGMLLTPPDVISQVLLALPMWGLFELGIIIDSTYRRR